MLFHHGNIFLVLVQFFFISQILEEGAGKGNKVEEGGDQREDKGYIPFMTFDRRVLGD